MVEENHRERICVFFSSDYPYETTLQNEFPVMSKKFDKIYYFPTSINNKEGLKALPENVIISNLLASTREQWRKLKFKNTLIALKLYGLESLKKGNFKAYIKNFKQYFSILLRNLVWAEELEKFIKHNQLEKAFYYDYWFEDATLAIAILKKRRIIHSAISRSHRFDLYDEAWGVNGKVPFRNFKLKNIDAVYTVAKHGQQYFQEKVSDSLKNKIKLSYLGIEIPQLNGLIKKKAEEKGQLLIVSVSNTQPFKRVDLIPDILSNIDKSIRWIHFGRGPSDDIIREKIRKLPENIEAEFRGFVPNSEVMKFLEKNEIKLFLSLSVSEGLPVSMMESIAYGIPVFACDVCGISDLVNDETGGMFNEDDDVQTITEKLERVLEYEYSTDLIRDFANQKFDFRKNYETFYAQMTYEE